MCGIVGFIGHLPISPTAPRMDCFDVVLEGLVRLQNRGYDSAGVCTVAPPSKSKKTAAVFEVSKFASSISQLAISKLSAAPVKAAHSQSAAVGIGHTRWATHGAVTNENAHPHVSCGGKFALCHNGIITNDREIRAQLPNYRFSSATDSEVIANLLEKVCCRCNDEPTVIHRSACRCTFSQQDCIDGIRQISAVLKGTYGLVIVCADTPNTMYSIRHGSPLLIAMNGASCAMIASEKSAFMTSVFDHCYIMQPGQLCVLNFQKNYNNGVVTKAIFNTVLQPIVNFGGSGSDNNVTKKNAKINLSHEMLNAPIANHGEPGSITHSEIMEQPVAVLRALGNGSRVNAKNSTVKLGGLDTLGDVLGVRKTLTNSDNIFLLGCGSSHYAAVIGAHLMKSMLCCPHPRSRKWTLRSVEAFDASSFSVADQVHHHHYSTSSALLKTTFVMLSQSGETRDLMRVLETIQQPEDCLPFSSVSSPELNVTVGVINVVDSAIAKSVDCGCYLNAGPERAVASTKSFTSQVVMLAMIGLHFLQQYASLDETQCLRSRVTCNLQTLAAEINETLETTELQVKELAVRFIGLNISNCFVLGQGVLAETIAKEAALKLKELARVHAEACAASSLKHGPFALLDATFPVILIAPEGPHFEKTLNTFHEVRARGVHVVVITTQLNRKYFVTENSNSNSNSNEQHHSEGSLLLLDKPQVNSSPSPNPSPSPNVEVIVVPRNQTFQELLCLMPLQLLALHWACGKKLNPDYPRNLAKVVTVD